jgi:hypothetical protein
VRTTRLTSPIATPARVDELASKHHLHCKGHPNGVGQTKRPIACTFTSPRGSQTARSDWLCESQAIASSSAPARQ